MINWIIDGPARVAAIGECMIERSEEGEKDTEPRLQHAGANLKPVPGVSPRFSGDTLNTLTYAARLLGKDRAELFYITAVGGDGDSAAMLAGWEAEGINTRFVRRLRDKLPGSYTISTGPGGERRFTYDRDRSAARELFRDDYAASLKHSLQGFHVVYLSGISFAILGNEYRESLLDLLKSLRREGAVIVYDPNYRAVLWTSPGEARDWAERIYRETDVALPGFDDEEALFNDAAPAHTCARLAELGITEVVVKNGSSPCMVATGGEITGFPVMAGNGVIDTTAAGDSFNASYISARLCGSDIAASVRAGQSLAGLVIGYPGAIIPRDAMPPLAALITGNH